MEVTLRIQLTVRCADAIDVYGGRVISEVRYTHYAHTNVDVDEIGC